MSMTYRHIEFGFCLKSLLKKLVKLIIWLVAKLLVGKSNVSNFTPSRLRPRRILLLNGAHVGDIIISTSILPILRGAYPDCEVSFVTGSWSYPVLKEHPDISHVHIVDHWRLNRNRISTLRKLLRYWKTRNNALSEIKAIGYDVALSLYPWYPDFLFFCWQANIAVRIGFSQNVFSPFATMVADFPTNPFIHQVTRQAEILRPLAIDEGLFERRKITLPTSSPDAIKEVCEVLKTSTLANVHYLVLHIGSGAPHRELPIEFWRELVQELSRDHILFFTGKGQREAQNICSVISGFPNCVNACDRLSWNGFVAAIRYAKVLYGVESMAGHVASAVGTRCVVVYTGAAGVARWRPEGNDSIVFTNHVPCAPCSKSNGCKEMACLRGIKPVDILKIQ